VRHTRREGRVEAIQIDGQVHERTGRDVCGLMQGNGQIAGMKDVDALPESDGLLLLHRVHRPDAELRQALIGLVAGLSVPASSQDAAFEANSWRSRLAR
jgi:hypothetical protein